MKKKQITKIPKELLQKPMKTKTMWEALKDVKPFDWGVNFFENEEKNKVSK